MRTALRHHSAALALGVASTLAAAMGTFAQDALPEPTGPVVLTISGLIAVTNSPQGAEFDLPMLEALGVHELRTTTAWTDGTQVFEGVLARDVLERVGASGTTLVATALNDFVAEVPAEELQTYDVLLATKMNGSYMQVTDKGPLWIVYPRDDHPELQDPIFNDRWVWQLQKIVVK